MCEAGIEAYYTLLRCGGPADNTYMVPERVDFAEAVVEPVNLVDVGSRIGNELIAERKFRNHAMWASRKHWFLGYYFCTGDTRLWVPKRAKGGEPIEEDRVINFGHPLGKRALPVLLLGYSVTAAAIGVVLFHFFTR